LSYNLFQQWSSIVTIASQLKHLQVLVIKGNAFGNSIEQYYTAATQDLPDAFAQVKVLVLNDTRITWKQLEILKPHFPSLEELHYCDNEMDAIPQADLVLDNWSKLKVLNLLNNKLTWKSIALLQTLPW